MKRAVTLLVAAALALPAAAQVTYKSTMPDGKIIYGDKPAPGAAKVEEVSSDKLTPGGGGPTAGEKLRLQQMEAERASREKGDERVRAAQQALANAEAARAAGQEPLEGERIGIAGGNSRLTEAYYTRLRGLDAAVENARRELQRAQSSLK